MRGRFTLTARHAGREATHLIEADSAGVPDGLGDEHGRLLFDATASAVMFIMNAAATRPIWARGAIELRDDAGDLVHEMPAKS